MWCEQLKIKLPEVRLKWERADSSTNTHTHTHRRRLNSRFFTSDSHHCQSCVSVSSRCQCPRKQHPSAGGGGRVGGDRTTNTSQPFFFYSSLLLLQPPPPPPPPPLLHHLCQKSCGCHRRLIRQSEMEKMLTRRLSASLRTKDGEERKGEGGD